MMDFKISIVQFRPVIGGVKKNLDRHLEYIEKAKREGASLVVFPELSLTGYSLKDLTPEVAFRQNDPMLEPLIEASKDISICVGGVEESEDYFYYNSSFFFEDDRLLKTTRKIYPPTYGVFEEKRFYAQGKSVKAFDSKLGRFGVLICNDARHPSLAYIYAMDGVKFLITQSAIPMRGFPQQSKPDPILYFENGSKFYSSVFGIYSIFANLAGHEEGLLFCGNSMVVAPGGAVIGEAPLFDEAMITVDVSEDAIRKFRAVTTIMNEEDINIPLTELQRIREERNLKDI
ncbi:MAG: hypothetical protein H8E46_04255 [FCB group bacterium]|nr:hypothetical protein [FCB group bacterium]